jgi:protoporphyrinogen oxidase
LSYQNLSSPDPPADAERRLAGCHIGIVGGGILGMTLALTLRKGGASVTLLEAAPQAGGLAMSHTIGPYTWDRFYHVILLSDLHTRQLLEELGIGDRLRWGVTKTGFFTDGKLYSLSNTLEFLGFPPLSLIDKLRLGGTIFLASRIRDPRGLERILCVDWLTRWSGRRVVEKIWLPLLKSKLGENYRLASASFIWAIIARMYAARRSGLKQEMFGYVDGGYEVVLRLLQQRLDESGVLTRFGAKVGKIARERDQLRVSLANGMTLDFDRVVATIPAGAISAVCPQLEDPERRRLDGIVYQGIICASLLLRRPLGPYYVTNITESWVPFTGVIEMTALVDRERFGGHSLVYLPCYLTQDDPRWQRTDGEIRNEFTAALQRMYPEHRSEDIVAFQVSRARQVLAISTLEYSDRWLPPLTTSIPGLYVLNTAQIAAGTLNVNETLGVIHANLNALKAHLARQPQ